MLLLEKKEKKKKRLKKQTKKNHPGHCFPTLLFIALRANILQSLHMAYPSNSAGHGKVTASPTCADPNSNLRFTCCRASPIGYPLEIIPPSPCPRLGCSFVTLLCPGAPSWSLAVQAPMLCKVFCRAAQQITPAMAFYQRRAR